MSVLQAHIHFPRWGVYAFISQKGTYHFVIPFLETVAPSDEHHLLPLSRKVLKSLLLTEGLSGSVRTGREKSGGLGLGALCGESRGRLAELGCRIVAVSLESQG